jgi:hypothetical protein
MSTINFSDFFWGFKVMPQLDGTTATSVKLSYSPENARKLANAAKEAGCLDVIKYMEDKDKDGNKCIVILVYVPNDHKILDIIKAQAAEKRAGRVQDASALIAA